MSSVHNSINRGGGGGTSITVVANYSALPDPTTVSGQFYWCENSQGTAWLPGSLGGTYYSAGMYYSNGVSWSFIAVPYQATQDEVNTGTNTDKFVTPSTFANASKWLTKKDVSVVVSSNQTATNDSSYTVVANSTFTDPSPTEGKGYVVYVRNGTATIGGTDYAVGSLVFRVFHSGAWSTREYKSNLTASDIPSGIDAVKIADGSVSNTEFQYLDGVTSSIQNQINSKQDKTTVFKNTTQTVVTGTTGEVIIYAEEVLANTISNNTILSFKSRVARGPRVGTCVLKLYLNTVNNLSGSPVAIAQVTINANIGAQPFVREQIFIKDNVLSVAASSNAVTDVTSGVPIFTISTYNINTTYYWILTAQPNTSSDSLVHNFSILEKI